MNAVLLRVGIDMGCGRLHSPLFEDGTFEFLPIPDDDCRDERTYGNTECRRGRRLADYFPARRQEVASSQSMHVDPEFSTFTYGDPTTPKRGLSRLNPEDLLVFYAGMEGWDCEQLPALYLIGFFEVKIAAVASRLEAETIRLEYDEQPPQRIFVCNSASGPSKVLFQPGSFSSSAKIIGNSLFRYTSSSLLPRTTLSYVTFIVPASTSWGKNTCR
jgi:hypothetical protein